MRHIHEMISLFRTYPNCTSPSTYVTNGIQPLSEKNDFELGYRYEKSAMVFEDFENTVTVIKYSVITTGLFFKWLNNYTNFLNVSNCKTVLSCIVLDDFELK